MRKKIKTILYIIGFVIVLIASIIEIGKLFNFFSESKSSINLKQTSVTSRS